MANERDLKLIEELLETLTEGHPARRAWRRISASLMKARRISTDSLPAVGAAAQNFVLARDHLSMGLAQLPPGADRELHFESSLKYLVVGIDSLSRSFSARPEEATPPSDSVPPPRKR